MSATEEVISKLQRFFTSRNVRLICPLCKQQDINIDVGAELQVPVTMDAASNTAVGVSKDHATYVLYCGNCGFILPFSKSVVDKFDAGAGSAHAQEHVGD